MLYSILEDAHAHRIVACAAGAESKTADFHECDVVTLFVELRMFDSVMFTPMP